MRNRILVKLFLAALCSGIPAFGLADSAISQAGSVIKTLADYRVAWLSGNEQQILGMLSDEVQVFVPTATGGKLDGKEAVREFWFPETDRSYPIKEYEISKEEVYVGDELAIVTGLSKLRWQTVEAGEVIDEQTSHSEFMTVMKKENGSWRIFRQMYQMRDSDRDSE